MKNYKNLLVWQKSHKLVLEIYTITKTFPKDEQYGLISQMRRSSASIPTNIAEGCGRKTDPDFSRFLSIAAGSSTELSYQILLSYELVYINTETFNKLEIQIAEISKMLNSFISKIDSQSSKKS